MPTQIEAHGCWRCWTWVNGFHRKRSSVVMLSTPFMRRVLGVFENTKLAKTDISIEVVTITFFKSHCTCLSHPMHQ